MQCATLFQLRWFQTLVFSVTRHLGQLVKRRHMRCGLMLKVNVKRGARESRMNRSLGPKFVLCVT